MHRDIKEGQFVLVHLPTGESTRTIVTYSGDVYFTANGIRYRKSTGVPIWVQGPFSVATTDEANE